MQAEDAPPLMRLPHPYADEIKSFTLPPNLVEEVARLKPREVKPLAETDYLYVSNVHDLKTMIDELEGVREIAIDLEFHAYRSYSGFTCLMQLSKQGKDYIVDTIALRSELKDLN